MKFHPDIYEVFICPDCASWNANNDDSGAAEEWRENYDKEWPVWEEQYPDNYHVHVIIQDEETYFRHRPCDICNAPPGDRFKAEISAWTHATN